MFVDGNVVIHVYGYSCGYFTDATPAGITLFVDDNVVITDLGGKRGVKVHMMPTAHLDPTRFPLAFGLGYHLVRRW